jgi:hypothetical protein
VDVVARKMKKFDAELVFRGPKEKLEFVGVSQSPKQEGQLLLAVFVFFPDNFRLDDVPL